MSAICGFLNNVADGIRAKLQTNEAKEQVVASLVTVGIYNHYSKRCRSEISDGSLLDSCMARPNSLVGLLWMCNHMIHSAVDLTAVQNKWSFKKKELVKFGLVGGLCVAANAIGSVPVTTVLGTYAFHRGVHGIVGLASRLIRSVSAQSAANG